MYITDDKLVYLIINKSQSAFDELIRRYGGLIKSIIKYHLRDIAMWQEECINDISLSYETEDSVFVSINSNGNVSKAELVRIMIRGMKLRKY